MSKMSFEQLLDHFENCVEMGWQDEAKATRAELTRRLREAEAKAEHTVALARIADEHKADRDHWKQRAEAAEAVVATAIETRGGVCRTMDGVILIQHDGPVPELWHGTHTPQRLTQEEWDAANEQDLDIVSSGYSTREAALAARTADDRNTTAEAGGRNAGEVGNG